MRGATTRAIWVAAAFHVCNALAAPEATQSEAAPSAEPYRDCAICPLMIALPRGSFQMGSPDDEEGRSAAEGPMHHVAIDPFALGVYEVTFAEYDACVADRGCGKSLPYEHGWGRGNQPAINVAFPDAQLYVQWLSAKAGRPYRLPSEAEWEYAARAQTTTPFHTGATISTDQANYNGTAAYGPGRKGEYREGPVPVGSFAPNPWGLHDMHGNVWEWVQDCFNESYLDTPPYQPAPPLRACPRTLRGGSWINKPAILRSAQRGSSSPYVRSFSFGFRVAQTLAPERKLAPDDVVLTALAIAHPDMAEPLRVVNDDAAHTVDGHIYQPLGFRTRLGDDPETGQPSMAVVLASAEIALDNADSALTQWIERSADAPGASVRVLRFIEPQTMWTATMFQSGTRTGRLHLGHGPPAPFPSRYVVGGGPAYFRWLVVRFRPQPDWSMVFSNNVAETDTPRTDAALTDDAIDHLWWRLSHGESVSPRWRLADIVNVTGQYHGRPPRSISPQLWAWVEARDQTAGEKWSIEVVYGGDLLAEATLAVHAIRADAKEVVVQLGHDPADVDALHLSHDP